MNPLTELLEDLEEYMDGKSDADHDGENFVPNEEMRLLERIRTEIKKLKYELKPSNPN